MSFTSDKHVNVVFFFSSGCIANSVTIAFWNFEILLMVGKCLLPRMSVTLQRVFHLASFSMEPAEGARVSLNLNNHKGF